MKAVILLSGGLDSATALAIAKDQGYKCYALSFNYGQRHSAELNAAAKVTKAFNVTEHKTIDLVSNYPDSQKVPHGLLKIGYSYQELGEADTAKLWYTDVRQRFPGTTASRLAHDRLKNINDS